MIRMTKSVEQVSEARRLAYPSIGDQLDAVFKLAVSLEAAGVPLPAETQAWIKSIQAVKLAHPKPDSPKVTT